MYISLLVYVCMFKLSNSQGLQLHKNPVKLCTIKLSGLNNINNNCLAECALALSNFLCIVIVTIYYKNLINIKPTQLPPTKLFTSSSRRLNNAQLID